MTLQRIARIIGVLLLLSIVGGGFGEAYVPMRLTSAATPSPRRTTSTPTTSSSA